jgi:hypothetical protein
MEKHEAEQNVVELCESSNGFLVQLRVHHIFDLGKFEVLENAIKSYIDLTEGEQLVSRRVVGCLFYLTQVLESMANYFIQNNLADADKVRNAHANIWSLMESFTSPD